MRKGSLISNFILFALALAIAGLPCLALSHDDDSSAMLVYKPPLRGAPAGGGRIAAAVRGKSENGPTLIALAPNDVGAVSRPQPVIYWYISGPVACRVEFTINDEMHQKTLIETKLPCPKGAGTYPIRLSDYNAKLSPGVVYKWFVTLEADPSQPAKDVYSGGNITYIAPSPALEKRLQAARPANLPAIYAQHGFWYDAFNAAGISTKKSGEAALLRGERVSLLKLVGFGAPVPGKDPSTVDAERMMLKSVRSQER